LKTSLPGGYRPWTSWPPSDPRGGNVTWNTSYGGSADGWGLGWYVPLDQNDYADNKGTIITKAYLSSPTLRYADRKQVSIADIKDGTSNTTCIGERPPSTDFFWGWWDYWTADDTRTPVRATSPMFGGCPVPGVFGPASTTNACAFNSVNSFHTGGANFLFDDGAVRFLGYSINSFIPGSSPARTIIEALVTRDGGENIPGDSY